MIMDDDEDERQALLFPVTVAPVIHIYTQHIIDSDDVFSITCSSTRQEEEGKMIS